MCLFTPGSLVWIQETMSFSGEGATQSCKLALMSHHSKPWHQTPDCNTSGLWEKSSFILLFQQRDSWDPCLVSPNSRDPKPAWPLKIPVWHSNTRNGNLRNVYTTRKRKIWSWEGIKDGTEGVLCQEENDKAPWLLSAWGNWSALLLQSHNESLAQVPFCL